MGKRLYSPPPRTVRLGERGRVVLPSETRRALGLEPGARLVLTIEGPGVLKLTSSEVAAKDCLGLLGELGQGRSLADELVAERHEAEMHE